MKSLASAAPQTQMTNGRPPATNRLDEVASARFTSIWARARSVSAVMRASSPDAFSCSNWAAACALAAGSGIRRSTSLAPRTRAPVKGSKDMANGLLCRPTDGVGER